MTEEEKNKAVIRRFVNELWNTRNLDVADQIIAEGCVPHALQYGALLPGLESRGPRSIKLIVAGWRTSFPDWHITIDDMVAEGDKVVLVSSGHGTHRRQLMGIAPTGRQVTFSGIRVFRMADGMIAEYWVLWDWAGLWNQLGTHP